MNKEIDEKQKKIQQFISDKTKNDTCEQLVLTDDNGEQIIPNKKGVYEPEIIKKRRSPRDFGKKSQQNLDNHIQKTLKENKTSDEIISEIKSTFKKNKIEKEKERKKEQKKNTDLKHEKIQERARRLFSKK